MSDQPIGVQEGFQVVSKSELLRIARLIEELKRPCGQDPESGQAIRNARYQSIADLVRALLIQEPSIP